jgi:hypothetical protein
MNRNSFGAFGVLMLVLSPLLWPAHLFHTANPSAMQFAHGKMLSLVMVLIGFGLIFRRKWAALYFSLPLFAYGISEAFNSIEEVTFPVNLLVMVHGLSLTLPLAVTIRMWKQLTWGSRFF